MLTLIPIRWLTSPRTEIDVEFMYSVKWKETVTPFEKRMENASANWIPRHDPNESFEE
ncbi:hypothetical protein KSP40_PGU013934 [Platanthera guangdongensis]|uniref:Uncharacterized protein n=1 Tax=Platanthera guangdongensis TaxID=2320717 RepID=A0ABR2LL95_9ASPA